MSANTEVVIRKDIGRLLAHGLPSKLVFDQACGREGLFNEPYLYGAINEIVVSNVSTSDFWIRTGYGHPALQDVAAEKKNLGRLRELDFYITPAKGRSGSSLAIEVKWTPSAHCTWQTVVADLYRLKLVAMEDKTTECIFVLCGPQAGLLKLLDKLDIESQKRAIGRRYPKPLVLRSTGSKSGSSSIATVDENGRLLGGKSARNRLPLQGNGKPKLPSNLKVQLLGEEAVGVKGWMAAVWRIS